MLIPIIPLYICYQALVISRVVYCNALVYGVPKRLLYKLQRVQNTAARVITRVSRRQHITPVLQTLHWLPVTYRVQYKLLTLTYRALHDEAPTYIKALLNVNQPARALRSNNAMLLHVPRSKTVRYGNRAFATAAPALWNKLPANIRTSHRDLWPYLDKS